MARIDQRTARTTEKDPIKAADDLFEQLGSASPKLLGLFASRDRDQRALNAAIRERAPAGTRLIGATTAGEIDADGLHSGSAVLSSLEGDFEVGIGVAPDLSRNAVAAGSAAAKQACQELGTRQADLDMRRSVGLVIDDAFQYKKEELLLGILDRNQGMVLVGGGAADHEPDPAKQSAELHVDGEVVTDAALVAFFKTEAPWGALRSHNYSPTGETLTITKVDEGGTRALEIDGKPAARRYADMLGVTVDDLEFGKPRGFSYRPVALRVGREYFMRAPWKALPDGSILFANLLEEDSTYEIMRMEDMAECTRRFLEEELPRRVRNPQAMFLFNCSGRYWVAESLGVTDALGDTFRAAPTCAGMNAYFEIYCGFHINTTLTTLAFGADS